MYTDRSQIIAGLRFDPQKYKDKNVLLRACLNVSYKDDGSIAETTRVDEALKAISALIPHAKRIVILAHMGRPEGKIDVNFSLAGVKDYMSKSLQQEIVLFSTPAEFAPSGENRIYMLENVRFFPGEESKDPVVRRQFAQELAKLGEVFINDAFPDYRIAASTYEIAEVLPAEIGPAFLQEIQALNQLTSPKKPYIAVLGGAKLSEKVELIGKLGEVADKLIIGGALAYTLLKAKGHEIGNSLIENDKLEAAKEIIARFDSKIVLPIDHVTLPEFKQPETDTEYQITEDASIPENRVAVDIGPQTEALFAKEIKQAQTILWNGPMGVFEWEGASHGTAGVMQMVVKNRNAYKLTGGGDSLTAIEKFAVTGFDHVSTGGGALLTFLSKDEFPTLDVIIKKKHSPKDAIIVYGTGSGNTELVCEAVSRGLTANGFTVKMIKGELADATLLKDYDLVVLACGTWNVGKLQDYFAPFYKELVKQDLKDKPMAVIGLGDSEHYDIFCGAADWLEEAVTKVGGKQIMPTLRVDGQPHSKLGEYEQWGQSLSNSYYQLQ